MQVTQEHHSVQVSSQCWFHKRKIHPGEGNSVSGIITRAYSLKIVSGKTVVLLCNLYLFFFFIDFIFLKQV